MAMRTHIAADKELVARLKDIANKNNVTLYALTNKILRSFVEAYEQGFGEIYERSEGMKVLQQLTTEFGFLLVPQSYLIEMVEEIMKTDPDRAKDIGFRIGVYAGMALAPEKDCDPKSFFEKARMLLPKGSVLDVTVSEGEVSLKCCNPNFSESYATFLCKVLEGMLSWLGYEIEDTRNSGSVISLRTAKLST